MMNNNYQQQLHECSMQIDSLNKSLAQVRTGYEQIIHSQASLLNIFTEIVRHSYPVNTEFPEKAPIKLNDQDFLVSLLRSIEHAIALQELATMISAIYPEYIPAQILDTKGFINRKINKLCDRGEIKVVGDNITRNQLYILPEWLDEDGNISKKYLKN